MTREEIAIKIADKFKGQTYFDDRCNDMAGNIAYMSAMISAEEQRKADIEEFLALQEKAIDEWNDAVRHRGVYIDKEGALKRIREVLDDGKILSDFVHSIADKIKPMDADMAQFVENNFWNLI